MYERKMELMDELRNLYARVEFVTTPGTLKIVENYIRKLEIKLAKELEENEANRT